MEESRPLANSDLDRSVQTGKTLRMLRKQADQSLESHRRRLTDIESELNLHFKQINEELACDQAVGEIETETSQKLQAEFQHCREMLTQVEGELEGLRQETEDANAQLDERTRDLEQLRTQYQQSENERAELVGKQDQLQEALSHSHAELESLRSQLSGEAVDHDARLAEQRVECERLRQQDETSQAERDRLSNELNQLQEQLSALSVEHGAQLAERAKNQEQLRQQIDETQSERDRLVGELGTQQERIQELESNEDTSEQLDQLQRKFDLALADAHKLKRENAELHEELVSRPEADEQESPELVSLRAERDVLATRVEELENAPPVESDNQEEMYDLQRRFEMAVEDVRQLKQDNASLEEKLRNVPDAGPAVVDDGAPLNWEAQKSLLLAELEAEDNGGVAPERHEARTTIEGTISITDRVVAEKDKEIYQLQQQIDSRSTEAPIAESEPDPLAEIFDQDELIQAERTRMEEARVEMEQKLREAEIEISVKRATLAREQVALKEKLAQLPEEKAAEEEQEEPPGKPRRRWLSALGLKEDEED